MSDERLLIPQDPEYFQAVGLAAIAFARLEWNAAWCCERLKPNYIGTIETKKKTAGTIAKDLKILFSRVADQTLRTKIAPFAEQFELLVIERNGLLHGKPATSKNNEQRLFRGGDEWTIAAINDFADQCVIAGRPLNALLYNEMSDGSVIDLH
ncbi:hypothetical protein [Ochrobactrum sp. SFR4]|uniref:hypothetical protein n=1 Tax=Ochrobactrum sp. SFR4 TaxID=2717368 RepID=UPI001C8B9D99|nr:hypothetical protein [Ochrobactrum sp. SFR4]